MARAKTLFQMILVGWILCGLVFHSRLGWLEENIPALGVAPGELVLLTLLWATVLLTAFSGLDYLFRNRDVLRVALGNSQ